MSKDIKLNDNWSYTTDPTQFILTEKFIGKGKDGKPKDRFRTTFHSNLEQCLNKIVKESLRECNTIKEINEVVTTLTAAIPVMIQEAKDQGAKL